MVGRRLEIVRKTIYSMQILFSLPVLSFLVGSLLRGGNQKELSMTLVQDIAIFAAYLICFLIGLRSGNVSARSLDVLCGLQSMNLILLVCPFACHQKFTHSMELLMYPWRLLLACLPFSDHLVVLFSLLWSTAATATHLLHCRKNDCELDPGDYAHHGFF